MVCNGSIQIPASHGDLACGLDPVVVYHYDFGGYMAQIDEAVIRGPVLQAFGMFFYKGNEGHLLREKYFQADPCPGEHVDVLVELFFCGGSSDHGYFLEWILCQVLC